MITREDIEVMRMPAFSDHDCFLGPKKAGVWPIKVLRIKNKNISIKFVFLTHITLEWSSTCDNSLSKMLIIFVQASEGRRLMALLSFTARKFEYEIRFYVKLILMNTKSRKLLNLSNCPIVKIKTVLL